MSIHERTWNTGKHTRRHPVEQNTRRLDRVFTCLERTTDSLSHQNISTGESRSEVLHPCSVKSSFLRQDLTCCACYYSPTPILLEIFGWSQAGHVQRRQEAQNHPRDVQPSNRHEHIRRPGTHGIHHFFRHEMTSRWVVLWCVVMCSVCSYVRSD